eukprot:TCONS_00060532-protein
MILTGFINSKEKKQTKMQVQDSKMQWDPIWAKVHRWLEQALSTLEPTETHPATSSQVAWTHLNSALILKFEFQASSGMLPTDNFNPPDPNLAALQQSNMQTPGSPAASQMQPSPQMQPQATPELTTLQPALNQNSITAVKVKLFYKGDEMGEKIVDNPRGLRIAFNPPPPLPDDVVRQDASEVVSHIYGPFQAEQIYFPPSQNPEIINVLEMTKRGLVLQARNGEILATRLCRAKIFYSDSTTPSIEPRELPREHTTPIFDYVNDFLPKFKQYVQGQGPLPTAERYFSFAQRCPNQQSISNLFVYVSVTHVLAQRQINQVQSQTNDILVSDPNMLDFIAAQIEGLSIDNTGINPL